MGRRGVPRRRGADHRWREYPRPIAVRYRQSAGTWDTASGSEWSRGPRRNVGADVVPSTSCRTPRTSSPGTSRGSRRQVRTPRGTTRRPAGAPSGGARPRRSDQPNPAAPCHLVRDSGPHGPGIPRAPTSNPHRDNGLSDAIRSPATAYALLSVVPRSPLEASGGNGSRALAGYVRYRPARGSRGRHSPRGPPRMSGLIPVPLTGGAIGRPSRDTGRDGKPAPREVRRHAALVVREVPRRFGRR